MKGLEIAYKFYEEYGREMIHTMFPQYENKIAAGLVGAGSELSLIHISGGRRIRVFWI